MRALPALALIGVTSGALLAPRVAAAQARPAVDVEAADKLYEAAKAAMERGDLKAACPELAESQRLDPAPGTLLNLGECEARSGKLATALEHFQEGRATLPAGDYRISFADDRIKQLTRRVPRLVIRWTGATGPETRIQRDGVDVAASTLGIPLPVDPGEHLLVGTVNGEIVAQARVTLDEAEVKTVVLAAGASAASGGAPTDAPRPASTQRTVGLVAIGAGGVSFGVGVVFGVVAKLTYDSASSSANCPSGTASCNATGVSQGQTAHSQAAVATGTILAGVGVAAGGLALFILAPKSAAVAVTPSVGANGGGLYLGGAW